MTLFTKLFSYAFLLCFVFACTQQSTPNGKFSFSESRLKKAYLKLIEDTISNDRGNITISRDSSELNPDTSLLRFFPNTEFWRLTIRNYDHWDYGSIPVVVAFSKLDSNDIRILFPFLYAESSKDFFDLFYNIPIKEKDNCSKAIANIFLKIRGVDCYGQLYEFDQTINSTNKQYTVTTSWQEKCDSTYLGEYTDSARIKTKFYFKGNKIKELDYQEWDLQGRRKWRH